jgi:hypothetical protein
LESIRALCVTADPGLRRLVRRAFLAIGVQVEFMETCADLTALAPLPQDLVVVDHASARSGALAGALDRLPARPRVMLLGDALSGGEYLGLLRHEGCDHLLGRQEPHGPPDLIDEDELVITSVKLLRGSDIFGLEKYLTWGVALREREVASYHEKRAAIDEVGAHAREVGCRRQLAARIETVVDELLMNALYDAPSSVRPGSSGTGTGASAVGSQRALLRYGCDGRFFGIAVLDRYGGLSKQSILDHLDSPGAGGQPGGSGVGPGAGLGLYLVLNSVTRLVANIRPGAATEVIGLVDLRGGAREQYHRARSLSIFLDAA